MRTQSDDRPTSSSKTWWLVGGSLVAFFVVVTVFWLFGFFETPDDESSTKVLVAVLALVGVLFTQTVAVLGLLLKDSIDQREADRLDTETMRNRVETEVRAVDLIGDNNDVASPHQISGAVLALKSLGSLSLALSLVQDLWPSRLVSDLAAMEIVRAGLHSGDPGLESSAAFALVNNANAISLEGGGYNWPLAHGQWDDDRAWGVRNPLIFAAIFWLRDWVEEFPSAMPEPALTLYAALEDKDAGIRNVAATALIPVASHFGGRDFHSAAGMLRGQDLMDRLAEVQALDDFHEVEDPRVVEVVRSIETALSGAEPVG